MTEYDKPLNIKWAIRNIAIMLVIVIGTVAFFMAASAGAYARALQYRDSAWEEAIRFIAERTVDNHPVLSERQVYIITQDHFMNPDYFFEFVQPQDSYLSRSFFDHEVRAEFDRRIEYLITRIPELSEREILFGIRQAMAVLNDTNTTISISRGLFYPLDIVYIYDGLYVYRIIEPYEHLLYSRLVAINGVDIDEVMTRFANVFPHESEYMLISHAEQILHTRALLSYMDVHNDDMGFWNQFIGFLSGNWNDEIPSRFSFEDIDGNLHDINLFARSTVRGGSVVRESVSYRETSEMLMNQNTTDNYWFEHFPEQNVIYVRMNLTSEMSTFPYVEFGRYIADEISMAIAQHGSVSKLIIDLRDSRGAWPPPLYTAINYLNEAAIDNIFILINHNTRGGGVVSATLLSDLVDNALLVGESAGHSPNFFGTPSGFRIPHNLPGNRAGFTVSNIYWELRPGYNEDTLMPDIIIPRNIYDHMNNIDSVLEAILLGF